MASTPTWTEQRAWTVLRTGDACKVAETSRRSFSDIVNDGKVVTWRKGREHQTTIAGIRSFVRYDKRKHRRYHWRECIPEHICKHVMAAAADCLDPQIFGKAFADARSLVVKVICELETTLAMWPALEHGLLPGMAPLGPVPLHAYVARHFAEFWAAFCAEVEPDDLFEAERLSCAVNARATLGNDYPLKQVARGEKRSRRLALKDSRHGARMLLDERTARADLRRRWRLKQDVADGYADLSGERPEVVERLEAAVEAFDALPGIRAHEFAAAYPQPFKDIEWGTVMRGAVVSPPKTKEHEGFFLGWRAARPAGIQAEWSKRNDLDWHAARVKQAACVLTPDHVRMALDTKLTEPDEAS